MSVYTSGGLDVVVYSSGTDRLPDPGNDLIYAEDLRLRKGYPGPLYLDASFTVRRNLAEWWAINGAYRVAFYASHDLVYEGFIDEIEFFSESGADEGATVYLTGGWGDKVMKLSLKKHWADNRIDSEVWQEYVADTNADAVTASQNMTIDRNNRIRWTPKNVAFATNKYHGLICPAPYNQTWKRITFDYDMQQAAQNWKLALMDDSENVEWSQDASGTGTADVTPAAVTANFQFRFQSQANQTPPSDGTVYAQVKNVTVYSETGAIDATEIIKDIVGLFPDHFNSDVSLIGSNTLSIVPYIADDDYLADVLTEVAGIGDSSNNRWACGVRESTKAATPNGKPVLFYEQYPPVTDYDLIIQTSEDDLGPVSFSKDFTRIRNYITVRWEDERNFTQRMTPDGDATLKDQTSIDAHGRRDYVLPLSYSTQTVAVANGKRVLNTWKDPIWVASRPLSVYGTITTARHEVIPVGTIRPGMRVKVEDMFDPLTGENVILIITGMEYNDDDDAAILTFGDTIDPLLTILERPYFEDEEDDSDAGFDSGGGGKRGKGGKKTNWKRRWGIPKEEWGDWDPSSPGFWERKQKRIEEEKKKKKKKG